MRVKPKEITDLFEELVRSKEKAGEEPEGMELLEKTAMIYFEPRNAFRVFWFVIKIHTKILFSDLVRKLKGKDK